MNIENMFELASRSKVRFPYKGLISTEDLWDLPLEALDSIYKALNAKVRQANEDSLLSRPSRQDAELALQIEIIRHVVAVKQEESNQRAKAREQREKKQKIMEIIASKQDEALQGKSVEELQAMLGDIGSE